MEACIKSPSGRLRFSAVVLALAPGLLHAAPAPGLAAHRKAAIAFQHHHPLPATHRPVKPIEPIGAPRAAARTITIRRQPY